MEYLFVLKDKGTKNQGWWLKITTVEQLADWYEKIGSTIYGKALDNYVFGNNYIFGKAFDPKSQNHSPYMRECNLTDAILVWAQNKERSMNIFDAIRGFRAEVALNQLRDIDECGAIYINRVGGYHGAYEGEPRYDFIRRKELVFPDFKSHEIRVKQFNGGKHYYAYVENMQVRDGDILKWDTYDEAYKQALKIVGGAEK